MQKNLSKLAGCLLAFGFSGACMAGEGASERSMPALLTAAQTPGATAVQVKPLALPQKQAPDTANRLGGDGNGGDTLATALLGLGLLVTVVYRARA